MLGLTWLAQLYSSRRILAYVILIGMLVDFPLGVFLQARVENLDNSAQRVYFSGLSFTNGRFVLGEPSQESLTTFAWLNWLQKHKYALCRQWLTEMDRQREDGPESSRAVAEMRAHLQVMLNEDASLWQGWYARHGGSILFFGDHFGRAWPPAGLLLALSVGLLWMLWLRLPPRITITATSAAGPK